MVIDELLENAVKFTKHSDDQVAISVHDYGDLIRVEARNQCDQAHAARLEQSIRRLMQQDPEVLFVEALEQSAAAGSNHSQLGIITLCTHARAKVGAKFVRAAEDGLFDVTVEVHLPTAHPPPTATPPGAV